MSLRGTKCRSNLEGNSEIASLAMTVWVIKQPRAKGVFDSISYYDKIATLETRV